MSESEPRKPVRKKTLLAVGGVVPVLVLAAWVLWAWTPVGGSIRQSLGMFDRRYCEKVVGQVRSMAPMPGEEWAYRLDDPTDPWSLRLLKPGETIGRGQGVGNVWASMTPESELTVVIQTRDRGHAGESGFAFSDVPLTPSPYGSGWSALDVPGRLILVQPDMQIDAEWWKVLNNLD